VHTLDRLVVPFRMPAGWAPAALRVVVLVAVLLAIRAGWRWASAPALPAEVPQVQIEVSWPAAPTWPQAADARAARLLAGEPPPPPAELPEGWAWLDLADDRRLVAQVLAEVDRYGDVLVSPDERRQVLAGSAPDRAELERYGHLADERASELLPAERRRRLREADGLRAAQVERGRAEFAVALEASPRFGGWDWLLVVLAATAMCAAVAHRAFAYEPVVLDAHGVTANGRRWLWEELAAVRWSAARVVLVGRDGVEAVSECVHLEPHDVRRLDELSRRLLARRRAAKDRADVAAVGVLLRRAGSTRAASKE